MNLITCVGENQLPSKRKIDWFNYYWPLRQRFQAKYLVCSTNDSEVPQDYTVPIQIYPPGPLLEEALNIRIFARTLPARVDGATYPRHWRSLLSCFELAQMLNCEHLLTLESDSWVLTDRLADRLIETTTIGCPWCPIHQMPEMMLCSYPSVTFEPMIAFIRSKTWEEWAKPQAHCLERTLPTIFNVSVWRDLVGDRYIERQGPEQTPPPDADFVVQGEATPPLWKGKACQTEAIGLIAAS